MYLSIMYQGLRKTKNHLVPRVLSYSSSCERGWTKNTNIILINKNQLKTILKLLIQRRANTEINKSLFTTEKLRLMTVAD